MDKVRETPFGKMSKIQQSDEFFDTGYLTLKDGREIGYVAQNISGAISTSFSQDRATIVWLVRTSKVGWL